MSAAKITTINPATEEVLNNYDIMTDVEINSVVKKSRGCIQRMEKKPWKV